jgi:hypothetical protein
MRNAKSKTKQRTRDLKRTWPRHGGLSLKQWARTSDEGKAWLKRKRSS